MARSVVGHFGGALATREAATEAALAAKHSVVVLRREYARAEDAKAGDSGAVKSSAGSRHRSFAVG